MASLAQLGLARKARNDFEVLSYKKVKEYTLLDTQFQYKQD